RVVRLDQEPAATGDEPVLFGDRYHPEQPRLVVGHACWPGDREDLERPAEVEHFNIVEDQDAHGPNWALVRCHAYVLSGCASGNQLRRAHSVAREWASRNRAAARVTEVPGACWT